MASRPSFSAGLCFDGTVFETTGVFSAFLFNRAVLVQNSSQLLPLLQMKLVISWKAWNMTTC